MADTGPLEVVVATKRELERAITVSGLSYEQPPCDDVERLWDALRQMGRIKGVDIVVGGPDALGPIGDASENAAFIARSGPITFEEDS